jgi:hypothetical protein
MALNCSQGGLFFNLFEIILAPHASGKYVKNSLNIHRPRACLFYETLFVLEATLFSWSDCLSYLMQCFNALWMRNNRTGSFSVTISMTGEKVMTFNDSYFNLCTQVLAWIQFLAAHFPQIN